jgi:hypothetical protein
MSGLGKPAESEHPIREAVPVSRRAKVGESPQHCSVLHFRLVSTCFSP